jgi:hypothetical protein
MRDALSKEPPVPANSPLREGWEGGRGRFLIDGFPRKMDQAITFDTQVCESTFILFFSCTEEVMLERLMERAKTSGREDDNKESIIKRFRKSDISMWIPGCRAQVAVQYDRYIHRDIYACRQLLQGAEQGGRSKSNHDWMPLLCSHK